MNKLRETTMKFPQTEIWNDSCSSKELSYAIDNGAVGATTNPVIVLSVLKNELKEWEPVIHSLIKDHDTYSEDELAWELIKAMGSKASKQLLPIYHESQGLQGRISFQTNAKFYNNADKMLAHAIELSHVVENVQIKAPTSKAGIEAFEEMTYQGISINATVSFSVAQAIAVAEAVERGLQRRRKENKPIAHMSPVCTIMAGRIDDYVKTVVKKENLLVEPEILEYAGVAVVKHAYELYEARGYKTRLLIAAFRNPYHWHSFIGGNIVLTIPYVWQVKYNQSAYEIKDMIHSPVASEILEKLKEMPEFLKAYEENGLQPEEFEHYGAFSATMQQFLTGYDDLCKLIRSYMVK